MLGIQGLRSVQVNVSQDVMNVRVGQNGSSSLPVVWASREMSDVVRLASHVGNSDAKVLIVGESGVGKDVMARVVHANSPRAQRPLITVNCAAVPDTLLESELFGHARGSFTGAYREKVGRLEQAHKGTLFLDEVGEMSPRMQALLLRFLENGEVQRIGGDGPRPCVDVRVLAATNQNLEERVANKQFRGDLLYRLRVLYLQVPPLRDRPDDIPVLVEHFLARAGRKITVSEAAMSLLTAYRWPGNVRELRNVVEQIVALSRSDVILPEHLPPGFGCRTPAAQANLERRRQVADDLYDALVSGKCSFWEEIHPLFLTRDITRQDIRELVRRGLAKARGNYRAVLTLFGLPQEDYKRFLNFLMAHECNVDYRPYRNGDEQAPQARVQRLVLPGLGPHTVEPVETIDP